MNRFGNLAPCFNRVGWYDLKLAVGHAGPLRRAAYQDVMHLKNMIDEIHSAELSVNGLHARNEWAYLYVELGRGVGQ